MLLLIGLVLPLCLDTFAVAAAVGVTAPTASTRIRLSLLFAMFEGGMPLAGLLAGAFLTRRIGGLAEYVAVVGLIGVGALMLFSNDEGEELRIQRLTKATGFAMIGLGLSVSLDELAIGFTLGLVRVSVLLAAILIAGQAFVVSQIGFQVGRLVGERLREGAERMTGVVLIALGVSILVPKLVSAFGL